MHDEFIERLRCGHFNPNNRHHLLVACMPKSGSTFLTSILNSLPDFQQGILVPDSGRREQELDRIELLRHDNYNYAAQHHVRYSGVTQTLIEQFDIKPIVIVRNIYDAMVSIRDHFRNESTIKPMGYAFPYMKEWPNEQLEEFIVDTFTPWYLNFYLSWLECEDYVMVTYDELTVSPYKVISRIEQTFSLGLSPEQIAEAVVSGSGKFTRFNVGRKGRGEELNDYCRTHINRMAGYYREIDFSPLGITV